MIHLREIRYVRIGTRDPSGAASYAGRILGLCEAARLGNPKHGQSIYFRSDERDHTLVYFDGDPSAHTTGFEIADGDALDAAAAELESRGHAVHRGSAAECGLRRVGAFVNFKDPSGNSIDLVTNSQRSETVFAPALDTGCTGFSHVGLRSSDPCRDEAFWTEVLGARVSDRIGVAPLLRIDEVHHRVALFASARPGVQHVNHQLRSTDDVMRAWYRLRAEGVRIVFGPGRHPTSGAVFLYFEGPDGMVYEYSSGVASITDPEHRPRQFPFAPASFCMWGARPELAEFSPP